MLIGLNTCPQSIWHWVILTHLDLLFVLGLQILQHLQVLLFPEGTDFTKNTKIRSDKFAEKQNLPKYDYVLHPRTTGFCHFVQEMKKSK